jgi:DNA-directed RNA polymerase subunit RPC12/RpoP
MPKTMFYNLNVVIKMDKEEIQKRIKEEDDYIRCPKCSNSIGKFLMKNPEGAEDNVIARFLMTTEDKIKEIYAEAVKMLRNNMEE